MCVNVLLTIPEIPLVVKVPPTVRSPGIVKLPAVDAPSGICVYPTLGGVRVNVLLLMDDVKLLNTML